MPSDGGVLEQTRSFRRVLEQDWHVRIGGVLEQVAASGGNQVVVRLDTSRRRDLARGRARRARSQPVFRGGSAVSIARRCQRSGGAYPRSCEAHVAATVFAGSTAALEH